MAEPSSKFTLSELKESTTFGANMLLMQVAADGKNDLNVEGIPNPDHSRRESEFYSMINSEGFEVAYYYHLTKNFPYFNLCQGEWRRQLVTNCGDASDIAEMSYLSDHGSGYEEESAIGSTWHECVFRYLGLIYDSICSLCFGDDESVPSVDAIRKNLNDIKQQSVRFITEGPESQRAAFKMGRELVLLDEKYAVEHSAIMVKSGASENRHSIDYHSVFWNGQEHTFSDLQARCVEVMWQHWEQKTPVLKERTIIAEADPESNQTRLVNVFKNGKHSAWGSMIIQGERRGTYRLN